MLRRYRTVVFSSCVLAMLLPLLQAAPAKSYSVAVGVQALGGGDPDIVKIDVLQIDGVTSLSRSAGAVSQQLAPFGGSAQSFASAALASGRIRLYGEGTGYAGTAGAYGQLTDSITFSLPSGLSTATVQATLTISGVYGSEPFTSPTGYARLILGPSTDAVPRGTGSGLDEVVGQVLSVSLDVSDGESTVIDVLLSASENHGCCFFDLRNTASLALIMPEGVTFTSGSGVLLTIPEPSTAALLFFGLAGVAARNHRRRRRATRGI